MTDPAKNVVELFDKACKRASAIVAVIDSNQWHMSTPCSAWDVEALLSHMVYELLWVSPLLNGQTIAEVGDKFEDDILGDNPKEAWNLAAEAAIAAARLTELTHLVHLSTGDKPAKDYLAEVFTDIVIHTWDLAKAIGGQTRLEPDLVKVAWELLLPNAAKLTATGAYAKSIKISAKADLQTKLLALTGRKA